MNGGGGGQGGVAAANCLRWGHFALIRKSIYDSAQKTPEQAQAEARPGSMCAHIYAIVFVTVCLCVWECAGICCQITLFANVCCLLIIRFTPVFIVRQRDERATLHTHTHTPTWGQLCVRVCGVDSASSACIYCISLCVCVCVWLSLFIFCWRFSRVRVCVCVGGCLHASIAASRTPQRTRQQLPLCA